MQRGFWWIVLGHSGSCDWSWIFVTVHRALIGHRVLHRSIFLHTKRFNSLVERERERERLLCGLISQVGLCGHREGCILPASLHSTSSFAGSASFPFSTSQTYGGRWFTHSMVFNRPTTGWLYFFTHLHCFCTTCNSKHPFISKIVVS